VGQLQQANTAYSFDVLSSLINVAKTLRKSQYPHTTNRAILDVSSCNACVFFLFITWKMREGQSRDSSLLFICNIILLRSWKSCIHLYFALATSRNAQHCFDPGSFGSVLTVQSLVRKLRLSLTESI
jgi:hypothetical protein